MKKNLVHLIKAVSLLPICTALLTILVFAVHNLVGYEIVLAKKILITLTIVSIYTLGICIPVFILDRVKSYFNIPVKFWTIYLIGMLFFAMFFLANPFYMMSWLFD
jgi:hypothetical protein